MPRTSAASTQVTGDPFREEQLLVHRHIDALGRHPQRSLELIRADATTVPDRRLDSGQQRARRHEQLHDRADIEDRTAAEETEGLFDRCIPPVDQGRVSTGHHRVCPTCGVVRIDLRRRGELARGTTPGEQRVRQAGSDPQRNGRRGVPAGGILE
jgi:hypothetical protein